MKEEEKEQEKEEQEEEGGGGGRGRREGKSMVKSEIEADTEEKIVIS